MYVLFKALLRCAIFRAPRLATPLRELLHLSLPGVHQGDEQGTGFFPRRVSYFP